MFLRLVQLKPSVIQDDPPSIHTGFSDSPIRHAMDVCLTLDDDFTQIWKTWPVYFHDFPLKNECCSIMFHIVMLPSGNLTIAIENGPVEIVDLPIEHGDFPVRFLLTFTRPGRSPEGTQIC